MAGDILKTNYNETTVQRICLTHELLNQIIDQKFIGRELTIWYPLPVARTPPGTVDNFTFGGLEMVKDIVTHPRWNDRLNIEVFGFPRVEPAEELDMSRDFLEHLRSYNGEEPKLVL
ncbi:hypothetical protein HO133_004996 [Letharia lupina]|uniref:Uncharacterized protein n=1 Tax=Letharia lupina TaxID=560253 RepID=A0A8H6F8R6_9LECA|nr:uncharacterized protein HO133_004996 [Letharia lupina]KAF6219171.1 hypothetical protein HO133_004996 [Letharia lupina]